MKALHMVAFALLVIGGLNVGLSALGMDLIGSVLGGMGLGQIFNILVGISAAYLAATHMSDCKACGKK